MKLDISNAKKFFYANCSSKKSNRQNTRYLFLMRNYYREGEIDVSKEQVGRLS